VDTGCGPGSYTNVLAARFPNSTFTGLEYAKRGVEMANKDTDVRDLTNINFVLGDAHDLPKEWAESFDMVFVYDVLHDLPNPHKALKEIYKVLKKDGCFSCIDIGYHSDPVDNKDDHGAAMYYTASIFFCLASSMAEEPHVGYGALG